MGVERAVTRWYVQHQRLLNEIAVLQSKLVPLEGPHHDPVGGDIEHEGPNVGGLKQELMRTQEKLNLLGPCPKPMMG